jgi:hypothetical protein
LVTQASAQVRIVRLPGTAVTLSRRVAGRRQNGVERGSCVKDVRKFIKANPLYMLAGGLILIVAVVIVLTSGAGNGNETAKTVTKAPALKKDKSKLKLPKETKPVKQAPIGSSGVIDQAKREGDFVVAQARGTVRNPFRVRLRISATPKQTVTVDWQLSCFKNRQVRVGKGKYRAKAPDERGIQLPMSGAETCIATAGAQLTRHGKGRVKVAVVAG